MGPSAVPTILIYPFPGRSPDCALGRASYKRDGVQDTPERRGARRRLVSGLESEALRDAYGFTVAMDDLWRRRFIEEPGADALDSLLCAVQGGWAYAKRDENWGVPPECDREEGWILDPALLTD